MFEIYPNPLYGSLSLKKGDKFFKKAVFAFAASVAFFDASLYVCLSSIV